MGHVLDHIIYHKFYHINLSKGNFFIIGSSFLKEVLRLSSNNQSYRILIALYYSQNNRGTISSVKGSCIGLYYVL